MDAGAFIKHLRDGLGELGQEGLLIPAMQNVVHNILGLLNVAHDEVLRGKGRGCNGLFVRVLAVDDGCVLLPALVVNCAPHLQHSGKCQAQQSCLTPSYMCLSCGLQSSKCHPLLTLIYM